ncbi:hypothetical protein Tco_0789006 [Tanacetum coccineum]
MVYVVNSVLASDVDIILKEDFVCFALQEMEIYPLMLLIRTLSMILQTFSLTLHNPRMNHTSVNYVGTTLIMIMIVHHGCRFFDQPTQYSIDHQPQSIQEDLNQKRMNDVLKAMQSLVEKLCQKEQAANESTNLLNEVISQIPLSIAITPVLPTMEPKDSLNMGDEYLSTIPEKELDEFIKSSVEDLVPIPNESEDTSVDPNPSSISEIG